MPSQQNLTEQPPDVSMTLCQGSTLTGCATAVLGSVALSVPCHAYILHQLLQLASPSTKNTLVAAALQCSTTTFLVSSFAGVPNHN